MRMIAALYWTLHTHPGPPYWLARPGYGGSILPSGGGTKNPLVLGSFAPPPPNCGPSTLSPFLGRFGRVPNQRKAIRWLSP